MNSLSKTELKEFLDYKVDEFNRLDFIELDPISIPHQFSLKEDIEIAAFLTATISWGNRKAILGAANQMIQIMGESPYDFIMNCEDYKSPQISNFYYRTFNGVDFCYFLESIRNIYLNHGGLERIFNTLTSKYSVQESITEFKNIFFELPHPHRTQKHVSDPRTGSAAKRLNMLMKVIKVVAHIELLQTLKLLKMYSKSLSKYAPVNVFQVAKLVVSLLLNLKQTS
jgi:uncharacterized protein (TIGR02757 family)